VQERIGAPAGSHIHYGLTSSDVVDTALCATLTRAADLILADQDAFVAALKARALELLHVPVTGRTHGVHAEPTTFGVKLAGFAFEAHRNALRLQRAFEQASVGALSGAVGTYAATSPEFEARVLARLDLRAEDISTQVVPRDRHAELLCAIALAGAGLERLATEIRHLQRTEVREVQEPFRAGQKGSSAMPHKRNPVTSEQISGLARVVRSNAQAGFENVALWHERDISHSSAERIIIPDSTTLADYLLNKTANLIETMFVYPERMLANLESTRGLVFSGQLLLDLVESGVSREDAYRLVQSHAMRAWKENQDFHELIVNDPEIRGKVPRARIERAFDLKRQLKNIDKIFARVFPKEIAVKKSAMRSKGKSARRKT